MMNLKSRKYTKLHKLILPLFSQFLDDSELREIRETFQYNDGDDSGIIDHQELKTAFNEINLKQLSNSMDEKSIVEKLDSYRMPPDGCALEIKKTATAGAGLP